MRAWRNEKRPTTRTCAHSFPLVVNSDFRVLREAEGRIRHRPVDGAERDIQYRASAHLQFRQLPPGVAARSLALKPATAPAPRLPVSQLRVGESNGSELIQLANDNTISAYDNTVAVQKSQTTVDLNEAFLAFGRGSESVTGVVTEFRSLGCNVN